MKKLDVFLTYRATLELDDRTTPDDIERAAARHFGDRTDGRYPFYAEVAHQGIVDSLSTVAQDAHVHLATRILDATPAGRHFTTTQLEERLPAPVLLHVYREPVVTALPHDADPATLPKALEAQCAHLRARIEELTYALESEQHAHAREREEVERLRQSLDWAFQRYPAPPTPPEPIPASEGDF